MLTILAFIAYGLIIYYLYRLEQTGCECAFDWKRNFVMAFMVLALLVMFFPFGKNPTSAGIVFMVVFTLTALANAAIMFQYVHKLKKEKCECSKSSILTVMQLVGILHGLGSVLILLYVFSAIWYIRRRIKI